MPGPSMGHTDRPRVEGFESFFRREHPRLLPLAVAMVGDREVARELVQEALLRAFNGWSRVGQLERPGAWARRVLVNLCLDVHRRSSRERRALALSSSNQLVDSPEAPADAFWDAVRALPRLQRSSVVLFYIDDLPIAEVADVLGVSTGSVKTSLMRARTSLAPLLSSHVNGTEE